MSTATSLIGEERLAGRQAGPVLMDLFTGIATEGTALVNMADIDGATEPEVAEGSEALETSDVLDTSGPSRTQPNSPSSRAHSRAC